MIDPIWVVWYARVLAVVYGIVVAVWAVWFFRMGWTIADDALARADRLRGE